MSRNIPFFEMFTELQLSPELRLKLAGAELTGAPVKATDLRGGAAMINAGLVARGSTEIEDIVYIERGYEDVVEKVTALGGDMKRVIVPEVELSKAP